MTQRSLEDVPDRESRIDRAGTHRYDLAVVGGGIAGACVARDAAMRGFDTVLLERTDFAAGTTAGSTRLIHGGLRYLADREFGLVREALRERETLARLAPHLLEPQPFLIPQYDQGPLSRFQYRAGMVLYDLLSLGKQLPPHERLDRDAVLAAEPALPAGGLSAAYRYHDRGAPFVERLCLEHVLDAAIHGATVLNHTAVTGLRTADERVTGVTAEASLEGDVAEDDADLAVDATAVVDATGPWPGLAADETPGGSLVRPTKGIHLVLPRLTDHALVLPASDGRVIFLVPWDDRSLLGTTDTDYEGDPGQATATAADVRYLLDEAGRYFPSLSVSDVYYAYAGVRPLVDPGGSSAPSDVSRRHEVVRHDTPAGLFSLLGAKITTARSAAAEATDEVAAFLGVDDDCRTASVPLPGARDESAVDDLPAGTGDEFDPDFGARSGAESSPVEDPDHPLARYGSRAGSVRAWMAADDRYADPLCPHTDDVLAQAVVAVESEFAETLSDVLLRRLPAGYAVCEGRDAVERVAALLAEHCGWDGDRQATEVERYLARIDRRHGFREDLDGS